MGLIDHLIVFGSTFFNVFLLGFNSKNVHQSRYLLAFLTSWGITLAQYFFVRYAAAGEGLVFLSVAGWGGGLGIIAAIYVHDNWTKPRIKSVATPKHDLRIVEEWVERDPSRGPNQKRRATDK